MEIGKAQKEFLNYIQFEKNFSPNTYFAYLLETGRFVKFLPAEISVEEVDRFHISDYIQNLEKTGLQASSRARAVASVKSFFRYLHLKELIQQNPAEFISQPKIPKKIPVFLNKDESRALLKSVIRTSTLWYGARDYSIILLFLGTGIRLSELCGIKIEHVNLIEKKIRITRKGNKEAFVYLNEELKSAIKRWMKARKKYRGAQDSEYLFLSKWGREISPSTVIRMVKIYSARAGIREKGGRLPTAHSLRHSFATRLIENGENLRSVQDLLGHASITSTERYCHLLEKDLRRTIERDRI